MILSVVNVPFAAGIEASAGGPLGLIVSVLLIVTMLYVIRDRRASIYKSERDAEREANQEYAQKIATLEEQVAELRKTRSFEPVLQSQQATLELLHMSAKAQQQTLDKLAEFNGSLRAVREGLETAAAGMQALTGTIAELHDIPLNPPSRG